MDDGYVLSIPVPLFRGGSDSNLSSAGDLQQKILKVSEQLKVERMEQDDNVAEFLKLVNTADGQQVARIRRVFEKKNQKTSQNIGQLQKKLEQYQRRLRESDNNNKNLASRDQQIKDPSPRQPGTERLRPPGPGASLTPPSIFNKPREFANLIRNKFGSADNIAHLRSGLEEGAGPAGRAGLGGSATMVEKSQYRSDDEASSRSSASGDSNRNHGALELVLEELEELRQAQVRLDQDLLELKEKLKDDPYLTQILEEEKYRSVLLEVLQLPLVCGKRWI